MSLTAEDIQTKQFHVRFRGFDIEEVDTFLERIAENFVLLNEEKKELKEKTEKLEMEVNKFYAQEKAFQHAIISAQRIADEMQEKSRREAEERKVVVQEEIDRLRQQLTEDKERLEREIATLQQNKSKIKEELRVYLQAHLNWLDQETANAVTPRLSLQQLDATDSGQSTIPKPAAAGGPKPKKQGVYAPMVEIDDLYEKIELNDDLQPENEEKDTVPRQKNQFDIHAKEDNSEHLTIPDLEGDMLFALEDPLDEEDKEPKVTLDLPEDKYFRDIKLK